MTLVDRTNHHLFQPLLYQLAAGAISAGECAAPFRMALKRSVNMRFVMAEVTEVDAEWRQMVLDGGEPLVYDSLIVACDAQTLGKANRRAHGRLMDVIEGGGDVASTEGGDVTHDLKARPAQTSERFGVGGRAEDGSPDDAGQARPPAVAPAERREQSSLGTAAQDRERASPPGSAHPFALGSRRCDVP